MRGILCPLRAKKEPDIAYSVNVVGTQNVMLLAAGMMFPVVFYFDRPCF